MSRARSVSAGMTGSELKWRCMIRESLTVSGVNKGNTQHASLNKRYVFSGSESDDDEDEVEDEGGGKEANKFSFITLAVSSMSW